MLPLEPRLRSDLLHEEIAGPDGPVHQVSDPVSGRSYSFGELAYAVLRACDGAHTIEALAERVGDALEVELELEDVRRCVRLFEARELLEGATERARPVSYGRRVTQLAARHPDRPCLIDARQDGSEEVLTWAAMEDRATRLAHLFAARGVDDKSTVVIGLPNRPEHLIAAFAAWKLGALVLPLRASQPERERDEMIALARPRVIVADWQGPLAAPLVSSAAIEDLSAWPADPLPDRVPHPGKAIGSGGSTGRPKIIIEPAAWQRVPADTEVLGETGLRSGQVQLLVGPLYHNAPFMTAVVGLFESHTLVIMERFVAARALTLIERHRVQFLCAAPTLMKRLIEEPDIATRDLSSLEALYHTGAPCAPWLKRAWIERLGGERVYEGFGGAEAVGGTCIRGDEWLAHPGSVGRSTDAETIIVDETGKRLGPGEVGEIFQRWRDPSVPTYEYVGAQAAKSLPDRFASLGDLGWLDQDGYLYLADRRVDLIISGGENIYPAEIEGPLSEHPEIADIVVIGLPDPEWGKRVHAIVQPRDPAAPPSHESLDRYIRARVAAYKVPKSYELVEELPRDGAGKIRRRDLVAARTPAAR